MKLVKSILTKNPCYTAGRKITVKGLMLHSVGCPQPKASVFINSWNSPSYSNACVHGFIDGNDGTVYQTLPWNHRGWHCGSGSRGSGNNTHIGVEMCEPACIKYTSGSNFTCANLSAARAVAKRTYEAAVELFAMLCKEYDLNPLADEVIISHAEGHKRGIASNHGDPEHLWRQLGMGYTMDVFRKDVKAAMEEEISGLQATEFANLSEKEVIEKVGALFTADQKKSGILASVSLAQFILESGYGKSELAQKANNCFGMKKSLSGNTWTGSVWDGKSVYTKQTKEQNADGSYETITADFRKYACVEDSIADHSAYILMLVKKYHDTHCEDKEVLITIRKAVEASPELRSKKELIETFINGINDVDDVMYEWHDYVVEMREQELVIIIEEERLKPTETRKFLENAFREGEVKTVGTDIDKIMPPVSRFGGGNRAAKKKTVIDRLKAYFDKFYGIGGNVKFTKEGEES